MFFITHASDIIIQVGDRLPIFAGVRIVVTEIISRITTDRLGVVTTGVKYDLETDVTQ